MLSMMLGATSRNRALSYVCRSLPVVKVFCTIIVVLVRVLSTCQDHRRGFWSKANEDSRERLRGGTVSL